MKKGVVSMKLLNKLIPVVGAVIGVTISFIFSLTPSLITVVGGGLIGLLAGAIIITGADIFFDREKNVTGDDKKQRLPKQKMTEQKKVQKRNTYSVEKKREPRSARPVKNILTLGDDELIKPLSVNQKKPLNILKLDDEDESVKPATHQPRNIFKLNDEDDLVKPATHQPRNIFKLNDEDESVKSATHQPRNIFKLDDEDDLVKSPTHQPRNIFKLNDEDEELEQEKLYSLNPISQKQKVLFQDPYNQTATSRKSNLQVNEEKTVNDVNDRLEQLKKTLTETKRQINDLRMILDSLEKQQENSQPKTKTLS